MLARSMPPRPRSASAKPKAKPENIFLFVPNLVGYTRIILALVAFYYAFTCPTTFIVCYSISALLDLVDGIAARKYNQSTKFGAVLDMVTDRVGTNVLILILTVMYPTRYFWLAMLAAGDYASHWVQMYSSAIVGGYHKDISTDRNWLLRKYYTVRPFMFACCVCQEAFLIAAYGLYHAHVHHAQATWVSVFQYILYASAPMGGLKQVINLIQLVDASKQIAKVDIELRKQQ